MSLLTNVNGLTGTAIPDSVVLQYYATTWSQGDGTWVDDAGNADMSLTGDFQSATLSDGNDAIDGDGTNDAGAITMPSSLSGSSLQEFSVELSVQYTTSDIGTVFGRLESQAKGIAMRINDNEQFNAEEGTFRFRLSDENQSASRILVSPSSNLNLNDGNRHDISIIVNDSTQNDVEMIIDGSNVSLSFGDSGSPSNFNSWEGDVRTWARYNTGSVDDYVPVQIGAMRWHDSAINSQTISAYPDGSGGSGGGGGGGTTFTTSAIADTTTYDQEPKVQRLANDDLILVYREGTDHAGSTDGRTVCRFSSDDGSSWGPVQEIADSSSYDDRNPNIVYDSSSGDIIVQVREYGGSGTSDVRHYRSTDNGSTWTDEGLWSPGFTYDGFVAWGGYVETSNGLMVTAHSQDGNGDIAIEAAFSTDGGSTWGNTSVIAENSGDIGHRISEPCPIAINDTDIIVNFRDDRRNDNRTGDTLARRSTDGGSTWESTYYRFNPFGNGGPMIYWAKLFDSNTAFAVQGTRNDEGNSVGTTGDVYGAEIDPSEIWSDPTAWEDTSLADHYLIHDSQDTGNDGGYATVYPDASALKDCPIVFMDDPDNNETPDIFQVDL